MILSSNASAIGPDLTTYFLAQGGVAPYTYSVDAGGIGGTIDPTTGLYTAPTAYGTDTITATDDEGTKVSLQIFVGHTLELLCDIIQKELGLSQGRVYFYNQKIKEPIDQGIFVVMQVLSEKPFSNINRPVSNGDNLDQSRGVNTVAQISLDIKSKDTSALYRKHEIILALNSDYARQQQYANSFYIGKLPTNFVNLSQLDGSAIPYQFNITIQIQYVEKMIVPTSSYNDFSNSILTNN